MKVFSCFLSLLWLCAAPAFAHVAVSSPSNGDTVGSTVAYAATASTGTCSAGVASMGIYVDNQLKYVANGTSLNTSLSLSTGNHNTVVEEWDFCGGATFTSENIHVTDDAGVFVSSPANYSTVGSPANFTATANTTCSLGVAAMGVYVENQLVYVVNGAKLNTQVTLGAGAQHTVVEEWDYCGGAAYTPINVTVQATGTVLDNLQAGGGWKGYGEFPPVYDICSGSCPGIDWAATQGVSSPSLSGNATEFDLSGTTPYSDVLWTNPLIGHNSSQNLPDHDHTLLPTIHNLTYDTYVYVTNLAVTQVLEFDISMYMDGVGMIWGNQCDHLADGDWDIWDNVNAQWVSTGVPCNLNNNAWNHITLQLQRNPDNSLLYQSITLNGVTSNINLTYPPFSVPGGWWGLTVNYQMDGNYREDANTTYVDNFSLTYW